MDLNRRTFLKGAAVAGGGALVAGLVGCASPAQTSETNTAPETDASAATQAASTSAPDYASKVSETYDVDLLIVGEGLSGLAAAVEAADSGLKTTVIDAISTLERRGPEGLAGIGSKMQKEQGIEEDPYSVVAYITKFFNYGVSSRGWAEMMTASGPNIDWLADHGVEFTGKIDNYKGMGKWNEFHWFPGDHVAWQYYSTPMENYFLSQPDTAVMKETTAVSLIQDGDVVVGAYAKNANGDIIQFNADNVILATGGCGGSAEQIAKHFPTLYEGRYYCDGYTENDGSGLDMAVAVGGVDIVTKRPFLGGMNSWAKDADVKPLASITNGMWINENGERYVSEAVGVEFNGAPINAMRTQWDTYAISDADIVAANSKDGQDLLAAAIADADSGDPEFVSADTIEELAEKIGVDPDTLAATVERYNGYCDAGKDPEFMKDASNLLKIQTAPFFAARQVVVAHGMVGGLMVNDDFQVLRWSGEPIKGLYAIGTESNMEYTDCYAIEVCGSDACNTVYSGRRSVQHIVANA